MDSHGGIVRTSSGRQTYTADGLSGSTQEFRPHLAVNGSSSQSAQREHSNTAAPVAPADEQSTFSGSTRGPSQKSSLGSLGTKSKQEYNPDRNEQHHVDPNARTGKPAGHFAGLGEENFGADADVEKQNTRNERGLNEKDEEKDPNLVDWDGPDDPGNPMNFKQWKKWTIALMCGVMT